MRGVEPQHQTPWDWRAAIQFIGGGTGTGLLLFSALAAQFAGWPLWPGLIGLGFVSLGLLSVFAKLGRRWRAAFVIRNPFTSWMAREALLAPPMLGLGLAAVLLDQRALLAAAAVAGLGFLYAQARILKEARGIPAWREPMMVPLIVATGLAEGASLALAATAFVGAAGPWLPAAFAGLLGVRYALWEVYRRNLARPGAAPIGTVEVLNGMRSTVLGGHGLALAAWLASFVPGLSAPALLAAGLIGVMTGWQLKFNLIARAAYNQGFALVRTPARTPGYGRPGVKPGWTAAPKQGRG